ncbi:hypothetical protein BDF21DRAFT_498373 [Thamnidium elegans]|nr:hypothetical protein BDF21DRAFT_498373 [Thamnidium elegans]
MCLKPSKIHLILSVVALLTKYYLEMDVLLLLLQIIIVTACLRPYMRHNNSLI